MEGPWADDALVPKYNQPEMMIMLLITMINAFLWAWVTAKIVEVIVNSNPDSIAFRNRMDDLNRYITFNEINPTMEPGPPSSHSPSPARIQRDGSVSPQVLSHVDSAVCAQICAQEARSRARDRVFIAAGGGAGAA